MKLNFKSIYIYSIVAAAGLSMPSCNDFLDREPISSITPQQYFNSAEELGAYAINYYNSIIPSYADAYAAGPLNADRNTDNMVVGEANTTYFASNRWLVPSSGSPDFSLIRAMNYFLEQVLPKYEAGSISGTEENIRHYIGEIYFMRASVYFDRLRSYGDYPIITTVPVDETSELVELSKRSPRNEVARFILEDLDRAISMLKSGTAFNKVRIGKELAYLVKSRVALYEGTFEKYHKGTPRVPGEQGWPGADKAYNSGKSFNIDGEVSFFLTEAMNAAKEVADSHELTQNTMVMNPAINQIYGWNPYFEMFSMPTPGTLDEVILWRDFDADLSVTHGFMAYIQQGGNNGMTKSYVDAFLMENGLPIYAANSGYKGDITIDQQKEDRDGRLQLFLFGETTVLGNEDSLQYYNAPEVVGLTEHRDRTGFRQRKSFCYDFAQIRNGVRGTNGIVTARAAEAYLNYLEASYLKNGSIDATAASYWRKLRERAGIDADFTKTIAATDLSKEPDWGVYSGSQKVDPTLYNIRRERRCEFIGEGRRWDDLIRWRSFDALFSENMGPYVPEGVNFWTEMHKNTAYLKRNDAGELTNESALIEQKDGLSSANISNRNDSKYIRPYRVVKENNEVWNGYNWMKAYYLSPYSILEMTLASPDSRLETSNLYQNPYWPTVASASALE
ncbi:RagB/SusD family nutrient uptake outer membrane protein [Parabacteroides faecis]|uniref:RagB/SusD family nutrient uptake outer membrane protein n=1 Tax=Parabacteroides TaxID=375288 RepID=UPI000F003174|nr:MULTISPECIES: RagB/SusD family nutrient uptake outer membrane protein [Parabacteroides]MBC8616995.1 RagB/SusD family nutrient uptake outer membrane protein [Parabacteroides faecis]RHR98023.1 RagB/SusD family nutrient uptake outer membrane protein [Parabacteroides sp. AF14-59]